MEVFSQHLEVQVTQYYQDQRPRFVCDGCGQLTPKNSILVGDTEQLVCAGCGYHTERKTEKYEHFI